MSNEYLSIFFLYILCINFLAFSCDESCNHLKSEQKKDIEDAKSKQADLEIQRRKEIAKNYLDTLARAKETWVDPYDMIAYPVDERQSVSHVKEDDVSISAVSNEPNFDNDYTPLFSDISGEVIGPNSVPKDDSDNDKKTGKLFSNGRHQICVLESIYVSRWLKMLIYKIERDANLDPSAVTIPLNYESLNELKQLSNAKTLEITNLDEFVSNLIAKAIISQRESYDWTILTSNTLIFLQSFCLLIAVCIISYVLYNCLLYRPRYTVLCFIIVISVSWNWMKLYQKQIAVKHAQLSNQASTDCQKSEFSILEHFRQYVKSYFTTDDCVKYYEALMVNPFWEVSLSVAISETITSTLFQSLYFASEAVNASVKLLFNGLSFLHTIILIMFIVLIIIMSFKYKLKFPFFMGSLEPCYDHHNYVEDVRSQRTFNRLGDKDYQTVLHQEKSVNEITAKKKDLSLGLFRNKRKPTSDSAAKYQNLNGQQLVDSKLRYRLSTNSSNPVTPTKLFQDSKKSKEQVLSAVQIDDGTESGGDCSCMDDDFDLIGNVDTDAENHSTFPCGVKSSSKHAKCSAFNVEQNSAEDDDSSIENICAACDRDNSNSMSMIENKNISGNIDS